MAALNLLSAVQTFTDFSTVSFCRQKKHQSEHTELKEPGPVLGNPSRTEECSEALKAVRVTVQTSSGTLVPAT